MLTPSLQTDVELVALHEARNGIMQLGPNYQDWKFPGGQQIAIIQKQLEHRLRAAHKTYPNPCGKSSN